jgi:hypothetical protein
MLNKIALTAAIIFLLMPLAGSTDLYLLSINSRETLSIAKDIVGYAHGTLDGKFMVELTDEQLTRLNAAGISVELVASDFDPGRFFLITPVHPEAAKRTISFLAAYSSGQDYLAILNAASVDRLKGEGYMVQSLERQTPLFYRPEAISYAPLETYPNDSLANLIVQDSLYSYTARLQAFRTRYIYADSCMAAYNWIMNKFRSFGYTEVDSQPFFYNGQMCYNVICTKQGLTESDKIIVVGGHYDSWNQDTNPMDYAPGADDNGSGTAAVLELARILKNVDLDKTIKFVAFSAEEVGLIGSAYCAADLYNQAADVEFMMNFDMIGYRVNSNYIYLYSGSFRAYADVMAAAIPRVTDLSSSYRGAASNSDHASFVSHGYYAVFAEEGDFNTAGWHTNADIVSRMDFVYMTKVVKAGAAALGQVDNAARPTAIDRIYDGGDGQYLRVVWTHDCQPSYSYKILYGTQSGNYTDSVIVPSADCQYDMAGLTEGQKYYIAVRGINSEGHGPIYLSESSGTPLVIPRSPANLVADPDTRQINLTWNANIELDLNHYRLLRREVNGAWEILQDNIIDTSFIDNTAQGHITYEYAVMALDNQSNESDTSIIASAVAATFNAGILFVDETDASTTMSPEIVQAPFYDSVFADAGRYKFSIIVYTDVVSRSLAGQYSSVFWLDDDPSSHLFGESMDSIKWYADHNANLFLAGWRTISSLANSVTLAQRNFVSDYLGISGATENHGFDFIGATGVNGWPNLETRAVYPFNKTLPEIAIFDTLPEAQVIYTFNSNSSNASFAGKPAGVIYNSGHGIRIALSFPVYYLTESSAQALITKVRQVFGEIPTTRPYGDYNDDGRINLLDILALVTYKFKGGLPPSDLNYADSNGDCLVNVADIWYMIEYIFSDGPAPVKGCVTGL